LNKINTNNFDFLRVVFASTVALSHLIELSDVQIFQPYIKYFNTRLAIDGFFVISGFLIAKSFQNSANVKEYIIKRVKRILPAYTILILVSAIALSFISTNSYSFYFTSMQFWKYLSVNLIFQNYIEPCLPGVFEINKICAINGALWTIKIEEAFYLLVPIFYWLVKSKKQNFYFLVILVYVASVTYYNYFMFLDNYKIAKQLPGALAFFAVGMLFHNNFSFILKWKNYFIIPCLALFILEEYFIKTQILKPLTFGFMVFYIAYNFNFLNTFGKYGDFTYGIYIYHFPIIQVFVYFGLFSLYNPFFVSSIILIIIFIISVLSWHFIELPFLSKSRRMRQKELFK
jgi:peptidoglycan/LPS O-acetylase OafA/YrhL